MLSDLIRRYFAVAAALAVGALTGCGTSGARVQADLSGPKPAALTFLKAIKQGDAQTAKNASIGNPQDKEWIDAMVALLKGLKAYDQALLARFGPKAGSVDVDLKQAIMTLAQDPVDRIDEGIVRQGEDTAEIDPAFRGMRLSVRPPIFLRLEKGLWKVDLPATAQQDPRFNPALVKRYLAAGKALHDAALLVSWGRYKTFDEAENAVGVPVPPELAPTPE